MSIGWYTKTHISRQMQFMRDNGLVETEISHDGSNGNQVKNLSLTDYAKLSLDFIDNYEPHPYDVTDMLDFNLSNELKDLARRSESLFHNQESWQNSEPVEVAQLEHTFHDDPLIESARGRLNQRERDGHTVQNNVEVAYTSLTSDERLEGILDKKRELMISAMPARTIVERLKRREDTDLVLLGASEGQSGASLAIGNRNIRNVGAHRGRGREILAKSVHPTGKPDIEDGDESLVKTAINGEFDAISSNNPVPQLQKRERGYVIGPKYMDLTLYIAESGGVASGNVFIREVRRKWKQLVRQSRRKSQLLPLVLNFMDSQIINYVSKNSHLYPKLSRSLKGRSRQVFSNQL